MSSQTAMLVLANLLVANAHPSPQDPGADVLRWLGRGAQVYVCGPLAGSYGWSLEGPDATLTDAAGHVEAHHGAGPSWTAADGSEVFGEVLATMPAPDGNAIPWLTLGARAHAGHGMLDGVAYILRTDTIGGATPSSACNAAHAGNTARVPYQATYSFVLPRPAAPSEYGTDMAQSR